MSISAHIFLRTGLPPQRSAVRLAEALGAEVTVEQGIVYLHRAIGPVDRVGGEVSRNLYGAPPERYAAFDGYDTTFEVHTTTDEAPPEVQRIFDEITRLLPWPALLVYDLQTVASAHHPDHGRTTFPPGTAVEHAYPAEPAVDLGHPR